MTMRLAVSVVPEKEWTLAGGPYEKDVAYDMAVSLSQLGNVTRVSRYTAGYYVWVFAV